MKWIIIDKNTQKALYGSGEYTMTFSSYEVAKEVADQLLPPDQILIVPITTKP